MQAAVPPRTSLAERTRVRVDRRLMPFLFACYIVANLDRANVGFAALRMSRELAFSDRVFGLGGGIFFLGYFLLEIPGTVLVEVWSARKWIARIMLTWGLLASATGWIHSPAQFYWIRFFLGVAEAGFFPGLVVYISHWYRPEDRGKAVAMFMAAIPAAQIIGAPLAALLLRAHWWGYDGWRWLLTFEGLPAIALGTATLFYLTDRPEQARWLPAEEREWLAAELERERAARTRHSSAWKALGNPHVLLLALILFLGLTPNYGLSLWLPQMVQRASGFGPSRVSLIAAIPYLCALPLMLLTGWHSDRSGERKWHTAVPRLVSGAALTACFFSTQHIWIMVVMLSLATVGFYCAHPGFWPLPNLFLGRAAAAASIGLINSFGNLGGFLGPYLIGWLSEQTGDFRASMLLLAGCAYASSLLVSRVRVGGSTTARRV
jgi:ACS family tartrate transporter-like MFS transporter